jgi:hypothetical protein
MTEGNVRGSVRRFTYVCFHLFGDCSLLHLYEELRVRPTFFEPRATSHTAAVLKQEVTLMPPSMTLA